MKKTLIFDYDGTIHDTIRIYESSFREAYGWLVKEGYVREEEISTSQIAGWLGLNSKEMWDSFQPDLPQELKDKASAMVGSAMISQIQNHQAAWYPEAKKALDQLKEAGYRMVILSNCKVAYREAHWKEFQMERWFDRFYDCESYGFVPKTEIVREVMKDYPGSYIVIGDRKNDLDCAKACESPFIGCRYGFGEEGELKGADRCVDSVADLPRVIGELL